MKQEYLEQLAKRLYGLKKDYASDLFDIIAMIPNHKEYDKQDLKAYVIGKALQDNRKIGSYGWNGRSVLALLDLIDEFSDESD